MKSITAEKYVTHSTVTCVSKTEHLRTYVGNIFGLFFNKESHYGELVREFFSTCIYIYEKDEKTKMFKKSGNLRLAGSESDCSYISDSREMTICPVKMNASNVVNIITKSKLMRKLGV